VILVLVFVGVPIKSSMQYVKHDVINSNLERVQIITESAAGFAWQSTETTINQFFEERLQYVRADRAVARQWCLDKCLGNVQGDTTINFLGVIVATEL
jgi:hypothetical protein